MCIRDRITIKPPEDAVFETGQTIRFIAELYPENTTEKNLHWRIFTSNASVDGNGNVTIKDEGPVTVTVYSDNFTAIAEYKFTAVYSENHFKQLEELLSLIHIFLAVSISSLYPEKAGIT